MDSDRIERVSSNLKKVSILLGILAVGLLYSGWIALPTESDRAGLWIVRIGAVMVGYASMKCFFINRYMRKNDEMET